MLYQHLVQSSGTTRLLDDIDATFAWQLWISLDDCKSNSSTWFINRFGLDSEFFRCVAHEPHLTITIRAVSQETSMPTQVKEKTHSLHVNGQLTIVNLGYRPDGCDSIRSF